MQDNGHRAYLLVGSVFGALVLTLAEVELFLAAQRFVEHMADSPSVHPTLRPGSRSRPLPKAPALHHLCA